MNEFYIPFPDRSDKENVTVKNNKMDEKYKILTDEELSTQLEDIYNKMSQLGHEKAQLCREMSNRELKQMLAKDGYLITEDSLNVDDSEIIVAGITLPVDLRLRTIGNPKDNEEDAVADYYDMDRMPSWHQYLSYPETPSSDFEVTSDWDTCGWDSPFQARGTCYFHVYGLKGNNNANKPQTSMYLDVDSDSFLGLYMLTDDKYIIHCQDDNGQVEFNGVKFMYIETLSQQEFNLDDIILVHNIKRQVASTPFCFK